MVISLVTSKLVRFWLDGNHGARAFVKDRRIITDERGHCEGLLFIPRPNVVGNPSWKTGQRIFRLTSSQTNSQIEGTVESSADAKYTASGFLEFVKITFCQLEMQTLLEHKFLILELLLATLDSGEDLVEVTLLHKPSWFKEKVVCL